MPVAHSAHHPHTPPSSHSHHPSVLPRVGRRRRLARMPSSAERFLDSLHSDCFNNDNSNNSNNNNNHNSSAMGSLQTAEDIAFYHACSALFALLRGRAHGREACPHIVALATSCAPDPALPSLATPPPHLICSSAIYYHSHASPPDMLFRLDDGTLISAHRHVLAECSPYFKALLCSGFLETTSDTIHIPEISSYVFALVMQHCGGELGSLNALAHETVCCLVHASRRFLIDDLFALCREHLLSGGFISSPATAVMAMDTALCYNITLVEEFCADWILKNLVEFYNDDVGRATLLSHGNDEGRSNNDEADEGFYAVLHKRFLYLIEQKRQWCLKANAEIQLQDQMRAQDEIQAHDPILAPGDDLLFHPGTPPLFFEDFGLNQVFFD